MSGNTNGISELLMDHQRDVPTALVCDGYFKRQKSLLYRAHGSELEFSLLPIGNISCSSSKWALKCGGGPARFLPIEEEPGDGGGTQGEPEVRSRSGSGGEILLLIRSRRGEKHRAAVPTQRAPSRARVRVKAENLCCDSCLVSPTQPSLGCAYGVGL